MRVAILKLEFNEKVYALLCVACGWENSIYTVLYADLKTFLSEGIINYK